MKLPETPGNCGNCATLPWPLKADDSTESNLLSAEEITALPHGLAPCKPTVGGEFYSQAEYEFIRIGAFLAIIWQHTERPLLCC